MIDKPANDRGGELGIRGHLGCHVTQCDDRV